MPDALSIGVSGLKAFQYALTTVSHNIANVNTDGYSRQRVDMVTGASTRNSLGHYTGSGVVNDAAERLYEEFTASNVTTGRTITSELEVFSTYAARIDDMYADPEVGMLPVIQNFFDSLQTFASDSGSVAARQLVLTDAENLAGRFGQLNEQVNIVRQQVNDALRVAVDDLQGYADALAEVNDTIVFVRAQNHGITPPDLLDQRDRLINDVAELTQVRTVDQDDGSLNLYIGNGIPLVLSGQASTITSATSRSDTGKIDIIVQNSPNSQPQIVTSSISGGLIGGLERFRNEILDPAQNQLGLTALGIAEQINAQHRLGVDLNGAFGGNIFEPMEGESIANFDNSAGSGNFVVSMEDTGNLTGDEYLLWVADAATPQYTLTRLSDNKSFTLGAADMGTELVLDGVAQGFSLTPPGVVNDDDSFAIRPTRNGARDIEVLMHDTSQLAAASPVIVDPYGDAGNGGTGQMSQPVLTSGPDDVLTSWNGGGAITLTFNSAVPEFTVAAVVPATTTTASLAYDPATESGKEFTIATNLGDITFTMKGTPSNGDSFTIAQNLDVNGEAPVADNRNAVMMAEMYNDSRMLNGTAGYSDTFSRIVSMVGTNTRQAEIAYTAQEGLLEQAKAAHAQVSGVNLDEEAANLLRYQQAYQAAAQTITVARTLFDTLIGAVR